jgi:AcrR family transcriptional regulator
MFQRARSEEQRAARRQAILGTAAAMLAEMPVAQVTLNELSRRAGLAKSNVLRYFESREAVLLELLDSAWQDWLAQLDAELADAVVPGDPVASRADQLAAAVAASLTARPMLCDLISAQAAVLERNVSPQVAAQYKRASIAGISALGALLLRRARLGRPDAFRLVSAAGHDDRRAVAAHAAVGRDARRLRRRPGAGGHAAGLHRHPPRGARGADRRAAGPVIALESSR